MQPPQPPPPELAPPLVPVEQPALDLPASLEPGLVSMEPPLTRITDVPDSPDVTS